MLAPFGLAISYGRRNGPPQDNVMAVLNRGRGYDNSAAVRVFTMHMLDDKPQMAHHSITSSAIESGPEGIVRPSAIAVFMLMTNSNLVGCMIGRSPGFSPLRIRPT